MLIVGKRGCRIPTYVFRCECGWGVEKHFKMLPSSAKQESTLCEECGKSAQRDIGAEGFYAVGGTNFEVQKAASFAMRKADVGGQLAPVFTDNNGQVHEVRNSRDIDVWRYNNGLGKPRMVEWRNRITGEKSYVPQRTVMKAGPDGMPLDAGKVIRESEKLIPLDSHFEMPSESRTGRKLENGVLPKERKLVSKYIDPETGKRPTIDDLMTDDGNAAGYGGGVKI
jgi:predicted nucleic acid-binding Zn ribbon protein